MARSTRRSQRLAWLVLLAVGAAGCELIVDFDRTKIDGGGGDGSVADVTTQDVTTQDVVADNVTSDVANDVQQSDAGDAAADAADAAIDVVDAAVDADDASDGATE
jgi:hypothetical protein